MSNKNTFEEEFNFGFTTEVEDDSLIYKDRLKRIRKIVGPLLENLCNSKGDIIKWPNRSKELKPLIEEFKNLTEV